VCVGVGVHSELTIGTPFQAREEEDAASVCIRTDAQTVGTTPRYVGPGSRDKDAMHTWVQCSTLVLGALL
jgi:hypothetical protein